LAQVLGKIPRFSHPDVLVGYDTADDAGVFRLDAERGLVQTVDFFTPVVDDPYQYGAIAAANALSDVYAMGGEPLTALAIACFPEKGVDLGILGEIMKGGAEKLEEAGVPLLGGHTVADPEIKFGYSVTGLVHPARILTNAGARAGDALVLTKPLGSGILTSGIKFGKTSPEAAERIIRLMATLNRDAARIMLRFDSHGATDITGNGLLGHAYEMAHASGVTLRIESTRVPFVEEAYALAEQRLLPRTVRTTWEMIAAATTVDVSVAEPLRSILLDPQTSGGLLIAVERRDAAAMVEAMRAEGVDAVEIGTVEERGRAEILVV
jgi:selenide,water dikinase